MSVHQLWRFKLQFYVIFHSGGIKGSSRTIRYSERYITFIHTAMEWEIVHVTVTHGTDSEHSLYNKDINDNNNW
jgi:hypothetical protein